MGVENSILVRLRFGERGGTHPPRTSRSIYNFNSRVVLLSDLLILFYFAYNQLAQFLPTLPVVRILYLVRVLYPVRNPRSMFYTDRTDRYCKCESRHLGDVT